MLVLHVLVKPLTMANRSSLPLILQDTEWCTLSLGLHFPSNFCPRLTETLSKTYGVVSEPFGCFSTIPPGKTAMRRRKTLLAVLLSLVGSVLAFVPLGRPLAHGFSAPQQELPACGTNCGTERWSVKTLSDADREKVDFTAKEATVGWLVSQEHPAQSPPDQRIGPIERQTCKVRAQLISYKVEQDGDFHIVIADVEDPGKTMIAEIPSPDCAGACASAHVEEFRRARAVIMEFSNEAPRLTAVVTGVGFFDFAHGQTGAAPNGIELHPVLKIELESNSSLPSVSSPETSDENKKKEGSVWVNTSTGVYHCPGTRWYGTTASGTFMTEAEAQEHGYRPAYGNECGPAGARIASQKQDGTVRNTKAGRAGNPDVRVWVNTSSGVYHCPGTRWYGNTKHGEYMPQKKAQDGGYRPAYDTVCH